MQAGNMLQFRGLSSTFLFRSADSSHEGQAPSGGCPLLVPKCKLLQIEPGYNLAAPYSSYSRPQSMNH